MLNLLVISKIQIKSSFYVYSIGKTSKAGKIPSLIPRVAQGGFRDTGDGGVSLYNHFEEQLGVILHSLYDPAIPSLGTF